MKQGAALAAVAAIQPALGLSKGAMSFAEYRSYDALGLAQLVNRGDVSPLELLEIAISRTAAVNPVINCVVEELYGFARSAVSAGLPRGSFTGVPFMLKDLGMMLKGTVTTNGSRFYQDARADYTSTVVERTSALAW